MIESQRLPADKQLIGAVEAGGTKMIAALIDGTGEVIAEQRVPTTEPIETLERIETVFDGWAHDFGSIAAFGVASFGPIDLNPESASYGRLRETPKTAWIGADMLAPFRKHGVPIALDTDVSFAALGEFLQGAGRGCATLAYVTVGTGIGIGIVKGGQTYAGYDHLEGGHIRVVRHPSDLAFPGSCPYHGDCLEGLASGSAILKRWGVPLSEAHKEHPEAIAIIAHYLAELCANLTLLHRPDRIVLGGGVMRREGLLAAIKVALEATLGGYTSLPKARHGDEAYCVAPACSGNPALIGAAAQAARLLCR